MRLRFLGRLRPVARRRWLWVPAAVSLAAVLYLGWRGGSGWWVRAERARAERAIAEFDFADGRRRLDRCLAVRPRDPEMLLLAARTARRDGDVAAARGHLDAFRAAVGDSTPAFVLEHRLILAQQGHVQEVLHELFEELDLHHPQSEQICEALAMGSVRNYQLTEALFWADELRDRSPRNAIGRLIRAQTIDTQGHREDALAQLDEVVADFPRFYRARVALADLLFKSQRYREAIAHYAALHDQRPGEAAPLLGLASSYDRLGDGAAAGPLMAELERRFPDNSEVLLEVGRFALAARDPARAEPLLRRAADLAPYDHEVQRELAVCLEQQGRTAEAREHLERFKRIEADLILLEKVLAEMSKDAKALGPRRRAGEICLRNGQEAEGMRWLASVLELAPDDPETHRLLADYYAAQGDTARAADHRRRAGFVLPTSDPPTKGGP